MKDNQFAVYRVNRNSEGERTLASFLSGSGKQKITDTD